MHILGQILTQCAWAASAFLTCKELESFLIGNSDLKQKKSCKKVDQLKFLSLLSEHANP